MTDLATYVLEVMRKEDREEQDHSWLLGLVPMGRVQDFTLWECGLLNLGETFQMLLSRERREPHCPNERCPEWAGSREARLDYVITRGNCSISEELDRPSGGQEMCFANWVTRFIYTKGTN